MPTDGLKLRITLILTRSIGVSSFSRFLLFPIFQNACKFVVKQHIIICFNKAKEEVNECVSLIINDKNMFFVLLIRQKTK